MKQQLQTKLLAALLCVGVALPAGAVVRGDANGDGNVDIDDVNLMLNVMLGYAQLDSNPAADVNNSGNVDVDDLNIVINVMLGKDTPEGVAQAVDLGLPSGTRWASWNLGAIPDGDFFEGDPFGYRYAWGETTPKGDRGWWSDNYYTERNYLYADNPIPLADISGTEYDAAHVLWGGQWRMPTKTEMQELIDLCSWSITQIITRYDDEDVEAFIIIATGPNGNSILFPVYYDWHQEEWEDVGYDQMEIVLWTSSRYAWIEYTDHQIYSACLGWGWSKSDGFNNVMIWDSEPYEGKFIRPVYGGSGNQ